jgi:sulfur relay (sulfurtransferase) complex TusBCD TusD component (DsrE family)
MNVGICIYSNDPETVFNALRFGNFALGMGDEVKLFLMGKGVETETLDLGDFKISEQIGIFLEEGGTTFGCGACLDIRHSDPSAACPRSTMMDFYEMVEWADKVVTF